MLDVDGAVSLVLLVYDSSCRVRDASGDHDSAVAYGRQKEVQTQTRAGKEKNLVPYQPTFVVYLALLSQVYCHPLGSCLYTSVAKVICMKMLVCLLVLSLSHSIVIQMQAALVWSALQSSVSATLR